MIPGLLAEEISKALREFIIAGFETDTPPFAGEFRRLVEEQQEGEAFLKGPYISIGLPFKKGKRSRNFFTGFSTNFPPHLHQEQAWRRLASNHEAANTVVATGTGSGKTECFMYPVLDHCQREISAGKKGIKVIVIYPMNALATDQAKRFAKTIYNQAALRGIRVGLFIGGNDHSAEKTMGKEQVISCKDTLRSDPPDILLTNYKMLDYLLMRPKDQALWLANVPETLRYLVVDELHTFDGAQGTDLALLIRRLKARLQTPTSQLICVGTSATLGSEDQLDGLIRYAGEIFDSEFSSSAIIAEQRLAADEFISVLDYLNLNPRISSSQLMTAFEQGLESFLDIAYELFFLHAPEHSLQTVEGRIALGQQLRCHGQVQNILRLQQGKSNTPAELVVPILRALRNASFKDATGVLQALLALLAHARDENGQPLVQLRVQLWTRELRRIVSSLANASLFEGTHAEGNGHTEPLLWFADDTPNEEQPRIRLPLVQCRECHGTAWLTRVAEGPLVGQKISDNLQEIYSAFFGKHSETAVLVPRLSWAGTDTFPGDEIRCCRQCGMLSALSSLQDCPNCQAGKDEQVKLIRPRMLRQERENKVNRVVHDNDCPYCRASGALIVFGARAASLSAVAIHRLFSSRENDDKKLITFSDSVQDAAHRSGFFSSRTWHNNIRMAISQLIVDASEDIPLNQIADRFEQYWLAAHSKGWPVERYLREFMPPESRYRGDFERFEQTGTVTNPAPLLRIIKQRVFWLLCEDLSWRSQVGRSLNRVGVAVIDWRLSPENNEAAEQSRDWSSLCERWVSSLYDEFGFTLSSLQGEQFLLGMVQHLISQGALLSDFLTSYVENGAQAYILNRLDYAPAIGPSSPRPRFPATAKENGFEAISIATGSRNNRASWYLRWLQLFQGLDQLVDFRQAESIIVSALECLTDHGLVASRLTHKGSKVWGLNTLNLWVTSDISAMPVVNGRVLHVPTSKQGLWPGVFELKAASPDRVYEEAQPLRFSFFRQLYLEGDIRRVIAHEHTGLLDRKEREQIENSFINGTKPWEYNLLSATPTLEMGIDIGDLSSVLLCSVPPAQANYLQRVGRGGRKDGNSFVLTVANGRPHDLVFYAEPRRMLDTPVEPPAVFLKAKHVLRRQLLAYAFDCWTYVHSGTNMVPVKMQPVLDAVEKSKPGVFPYTLLGFISDNMQSLWEGFSEKIAHALSEEELINLRMILFGGGVDQIDPLHNFVNARLKLVAEERQNLVANIEAINKKVKSLQKQPDDEQKAKILGELDEELLGFKRLRARLNEKDTLNFFTDEGLLPNYAFPEEGTTLHSIIFRREEGAAMSAEAEREWVKREYEYQRPAQAALVELAPSSVFYAGNRKVRVTRVETAKGRNIQQWRFCPRCHYSASMDDPKRGYHSPTCPRCQSVMWADASAATKMLKMTQVYAFTNARDAQLDDGSDDREPEFFNRQMLIDFDPKNILSTWVLEDDSHPFGFEFIRVVDFLEVNFGRSDAEGESTEVAGKLLNRSGFQICESCGKVQHARKAAEHLNTCPHYQPSSSSSLGANRSNAESQNGIIRCLYLYRQFTSEAMRILLPTLAFGGTDQQVQSFVAALQLGLKRQFGGKVDHLRVAHQSEPVGDSDARKHFLVLYDSVPGGTGYLQELLANVENMKAVFTHAWDTMNNCDCYEGKMDGCYRCLLEYRNSYGMEQTKKSVAMSMLSEVINPDNHWRLTEKSLSSLNQTPWVDSELEARFPLAVEAFSGHPAVACQKVRVRKDVINQKNGHRILIGEHELTMEPHVMIGASEGVAFQSELDFLIRDVEGRLPPIAIFLDGYEFHHAIVQDDLLKRQALMHAGYVVWSLNWYDINQVLGDKASELPLLSRMIADPFHQLAVNKVGSMMEVQPLLSWAGRTNLERLMRMLNTDSGVSFGKMMAGQAWYFILTTVPQSYWGQQAANLQQMEKECEGLPPDFQDRISKQPAAASIVDWPTANGGKNRLGFVCGASALQAGNFRDTSVMLCYEQPDTQSSTARQQWQIFWSTINVLQFLPNFYAYTPGSKLDGIAVSLRWPAEPLGVAVEWQLAERSTVLPKAPSGEHDSEIQSHEVTLAWLDELGAQLKDEFLSIDARLSKLIPSAPVVFYELMDDLGEIVAEAELAWEEERLALLVAEQSDFAAVFHEFNWLTFLSVKELVAHMENASHIEQG